MTRRCLIRSLFMLPILLCVAGCDALVLPVQNQVIGPTTTPATTQTDLQTTLGALGVTCAYGEAQDSFVIGQIDFDHKVFYPWKSFTLTREQLPEPYHGRMSALPVFDPKQAGWKTVPVDPPIRYLKVDAQHVVPGFLATDFYQWKGEKLEITSVPKTAVELTPWEQYQWLGRPHQTGMQPANRSPILDPALFRPLRIIEVETPAARKQELIPAK